MRPIALEPRANAGGSVIARAFGTGAVFPARFDGKEAIAHADIVAEPRRSRRPKNDQQNCSTVLAATASCALASLLAIYFFSVSRFASQSRDWGWPFRSVSTFPLIESPLILPLYLAVSLFPLTS